MIALSWRNPVMICIKMSGMFNVITSFVCFPPPIYKFTLYSLLFQNNNNNTLNQLFVNKILPNFWPLHNIFFPM